MLFRSLAGEQNIRASGCKHLIFRTSWVYSPRGQNFVKTVLRLAEQRPELRVVADQIGTPTSARFIADATSGILSGLLSSAVQPTHEFNDVYHLTAANYTSWHGFARKILDEYNRMFPRSKYPPTLFAIPTDEYPLPAPRPRNSRLNCSRLFTDFRMYQPAWTTSLQLCLDELEGCNFD